MKFVQITDLHLTRPGEKDDLMDLFRSQMDDYRHKRDEAARKRARKEK